MTGWYRKYNGVRQMETEWQKNNQHGGGGVQREQDPKKCEGV